MIGIVIVAHGRLAQEFLAAVEHVVGIQPQTRAVEIRFDSDRNEKQEEINAAVKQVDSGDGVVVVTDIYGGTPSNLAVNACDSTKRAVLYGANLPMLVKLAKARNKSLSQAVNAAVDAGHRYLDCTGDILEN